MSELGRFLVTKQPHDIGGFRTMGLRNLLVTEPYFHDGSQPTLWDIVDHYNKGGVQNPYLDGGIVPLGLTEPEIDDLVAFLATLTSPEYARRRADGVPRAVQAIADRPSAARHRGRDGPKGAQRSGLRGAVWRYRTRTERRKSGAARRRLNGIHPTLRPRQTMAVRHKSVETKYMENATGAARTAQARSPHLPESPRRQRRRRAGARA